MEFFIQITLFAIIASSIYALIASGLTLTFSTLEFINFAHGEIAMTGAFIFFALYSLFQLPLWLSFLLSILFCAALGIFIEKTTFKPVRDRQPFIPLILSIGVSIILKSVVTMIFGGGAQTYIRHGSVPKVYYFFDGSIFITRAQIVIIVASILTLVFLFLFLYKTKIGKTIRAVSDNKQMASLFGISVDRTLSITFALASLLAGISGILVAFDQNLSPTMGLDLGIKVFSAIVIGGVGSFHGAILGSLIIGFSENFIIGFTNMPGSFKQAFVFLILIFVLFVRPYGIFGGKKEIVESR